MSESDTARLVYQVPFHQIPDDLIRDYRTNVYHIAVFSALAMHANKDRAAWPSQNRLSHMTGASRNKVKQTLTELEEFGWLTSQTRFDEISGRYSSTIYFLSPSLQGRSSHDQGVGHGMTKGWSSRAQEPDPLNHTHKNQRERSLKREMLTHPVHNVPCGKKQYANLVDDYGNKIVDDYIERVVNWCAARGKSYKDYAAAAANWLKRDKVPKKSNPYGDDYVWSEEDGIWYDKRTLPL